MSKKMWLGAVFGGAALAFGNVVGANAAAIPFPDSGIAVYGQAYIGNDCAGELGSPFANCALNGSPVIAKFNTDGTGWEYNNGLLNFPTIDGSEFSFSPAAPGEETKSGFFTYTPGVGDPGLTGWVVKAGNAFVAFEYTGAQGVSTAWSTALLDNKGLSHITFYDTAYNGNGNGGGGPVPEPATLALLGAGLLGLGLARRARRKA